MKYLSLLFISFSLLICSAGFREKGHGNKAIILKINTISPSNDSSNDGEITADITGGTAPYEVRFMGPEQNHKISNNNHLQIKNLKKGNYLFIVRDKDGNIKHQEIQL